MQMLSTQVNLDDTYSLSHSNQLIKNLLIELDYNLSFVHNNNTT